MPTRRHRLGRLLSVLVSCAVGATLAAQNPQTTGAPPAPAPAGQRTGGAGRGRAPIQPMTLETSGWTDGAPIPTKYTQAGHDVSPPLSWSNAPDPTASFVLIAHDLDTPVTPGTDDLLQWMLWNIPGTTHSLAEGQMQGPQLSDGTRQISATGPYYRGPAAPATGPIHHYVFEIFALDATIDVPAVGTQPPATRAAVLSAMANHVRGKGTLVGTYRRPEAK
jgi:Raf kinase inhibitor-like YbhB/YbcL family protein